MHLQTMRRLLFAYSFLENLPDDMAEFRQSLRHQQHAGVYVLRRIFRLDPEQGRKLAQQYVEGRQTPATLASFEKALREQRGLNLDSEVHLSRTAFCQRLRRKIIDELKRAEGSPVDVVWAARRWKRSDDPEDTDAKLDHVQLAMQNPATKLILRQPAKRGIVLVHPPTKKIASAAQDRDNDFELSIDIGWAASLAPLNYDAYHVAFAEHDRLRIIEEISRYRAQRSKALLM